MEQPANLLYDEDTVDSSQITINSNNGPAAKDHDMCQQSPIYVELTNSADGGNVDSSHPQDEESHRVDAEMYQLLSLWGFVDLYDYFISLKLNVNTLKFIDNEDLKELFSNRPFGTRVEFKQKLYQWRRDNGIIIPSDPSESFLNNVKALLEELVENNLAEHMNDNANDISRTPSPSSPSIGFGNFLR